MVFSRQRSLFPAARKLVTNPRNTQNHWKVWGRCPTLAQISISTLSFLDRTTSSFYSWKGIQVSSFERRHFSDKKQDPENRLQRAAGPLSRARSQGARVVGHHHPPFLERVPVVTGTAPRDHLILENVVLPLSTRTGGWPKQTLPIHNSLSARLSLSLS